MKQFAKRSCSFLMAAIMCMSLMSGLTLHANAADTWTLVTSASDLAAGDTVVLVAANATLAMSTAQNSNNRGTASVTKSGDTVTITDSVQILTLEAGSSTGTFAFYTGSGYLCAASSSNNYLRTKTTKDANSSWNISITSAGVATVKATGSYTRNWMRYNSTNKIFACYSSGQGDICIYKKEVSSAPSCSHTNTTETITPATCVDTGSKVVTCLDCQEVISQETIPATGHTLDSNNACINCDYVLDTNGFTLIDLNDPPVAGEYVIGAVKGGKYPTVYLATSTISNDWTVSTSSVKAENDMISASAVTGTMQVFTFTGDNTNGFTIGCEKNGTMQYLGYSSTSNRKLALGANYSTTKWKIVADTEGGFALSCTTDTYTISQNSTADTAIRGYATTTIYNGIYLFAKAAAQPEPDEPCTHETTQEQIITAATCTTEGEKQIVCASCGEVQRTEVIPATGHTDADSNNTCDICGAIIHVPTPDYSGNYVIAVNRATGGNYYYMTRDLGTASTSRYTAVDSGLTQLPERIDTAFADRVFTFVKQDDGTYTICAYGMENGYLGHESGQNNGLLVAQTDAIKATVELNGENYNIHYTGSDAERYLAMNNSNDYFAWYKSGQKQNLSLIPVTNVQTCLHEQTTLSGVVDATCTTGGYSGDTVCASCGTVITEGADTPALGHIDEDSDKVCDRCQEKILDYSGEYQIAAKRSSGNYFFMNGALTTTSTKRYVATDSGLTELPETVAPNADLDFVFVKNSDNTYHIYVKNLEGDNYLGWTSGNSGALVSAENALDLTIEATENGYHILYNDRYLSLNNTTGNNYFAWYASGQANELALLPVAEPLAQVGDTQYTSLTEAAAAASAANKCMTLLASSNQDMTVANDLYLDLNGFSLTGAVTVDEGATLYGIDSTTNDYDCSDGYGKIANVTGDVAIHHKTSVTGKVLRYLTCTEQDGISFHRIYLGITKMSLRPGADSVGYKAVFGGDSLVVASLGEAEAYGYGLWLEGYESHKVSVFAERDSFVSGKDVTLRLENFDIENFSQTPVYAEVYLKLATGETITSSQYSYTLKYLVEQINRDISLYTTEQMKALQYMCNKYTSVMEGWNIGNIQDWTAPAA